MSTPFVFQTAADTARTGDLATVLALATDENGEIDASTRAQMMTGIAERTDINAKVFKRLADNLPYECYTLLCAMLNNPLLRRAPKTFTAVRQSISPDSLPTLINHLDDPAEFLPDFLRAASRFTRIPNITTYVTAAFDADHIAATVDQMVEDYLATLTLDQRASEDIPQLLFLTEDHITRIATAVRDMLRVCAADDYSTTYDSRAFVPISVMRRLAERDDLTDEHGHLIFDAIDALLAIEQHQNALYSEQMGERGQQWPGLRSQVPGVLHNSKLPQSALVRALLNPDIVTAMNSDRHTTLGIDFGTVVEALRQGAPISLLHHYTVINMPADVLDLVLDQAETSMTSPTDDDRETLRAVVYNSINLVGTAQWDRLYALWVNVMTEDTEDGNPHDQFAVFVERRSMNYSDNSTTPTLHRFAAWASQSDDPRLRRHAVKYIWSPEQMVAATQDPSPLVRLQALDHEFVPESILVALHDDDDYAVRFAVAMHRDATSHVLTLMQHDADPTVRLEVVKHEQAPVEVLRALADDPDATVRGVVANKFLNAFA
jgi:hypothetical protein